MYYDTFIVCVITSIVYCKFKKFHSPWIFSIYSQFIRNSMQFIKIITSSTIVYRLKAFVYKSVGSLMKSETMQSRI